MPSMGGVHSLGGGAAGALPGQDLAWPGLADLPALCSPLGGTKYVMI